MPNIPLYQTSVAPTKQTPNVEASAQAAAAPFEALARVGAITMDVALDYQDKKNALKQDADKADYSLRKKQLDREIEEKKQEARLSGVHYSELTDTVVNPLLSAFEQENLSRGYSKSSLGEISQDWEFNKQSIMSASMAEREKMELEDYVFRIDQEAQRLAISEDEDELSEANRLYDVIAGIKGEEEARTMRSGALYGNYNDQAAQIEQFFHEGLIGPEDALARLESLDRQLKDDGNVLEQHRSSANTTIDGKKRFLIKKVNSEAERVFKNLTAPAKKALSDTDWQEIERYLGPTLGQSMREANKTNVIGQSVSDSDVAGGAKALNNFRIGDYPLSQFTREIKDIGGLYGVWLHNTAELINEDAAKTDEFNAYESRFRKNVTIKGGGETSDWVGEINSYMDFQTEDKDDFYNKAMIAYMDWRNDESSDKPTYEEFKGKHFKTAAEDVARNLGAQPNEEVGGYIVGQTYVDDAGGRAIWDGKKFNEVEN